LTSPKVKEWQADAWTEWNALSDDWLALPIPEWKAKPGKEWTGEPIPEWQAGAWTKWLAGSNPEWKAKGCG
jgi:hypothetical protein